MTLYVLALFVYVLGVLGMFVDWRPATLLSR